MAVHCVVTERGGLIKKKEKKSSWVKLKVFPINVGRPPPDVRREGLNFTGGLIMTVLLLFTKLVLCVVFVY